eukprot:4174186-Pleurochrysis_carterae.AAC.1
MEPGMAGPPSTKMRADRVTAVVKIPQRSHAAFTVTEHIKKSCLQSKAVSGMAKRWKLGRHSNPSRSGFIATVWQREEERVCLIQPSSRVSAGLGQDTEPMRHHTHPGIFGGLEVAVFIGHSLQDQRERQKPDGLCQAQHRLTMRAPFS